MNELAQKDIPGFLRLLLGPSNTEVPEKLDHTILWMGYWGDSSAYMMVRLHSMLFLLSKGNLYVHAVFCAALSCLGFSFLIRAWTISGNRLSDTQVLFILFFPSVLFWTSGVHKESLWIFLAGLAICGWVSWVIQKNPFALIALLAGLFYLYVLRDFSSLLILAGLISWTLFRNQRNIKGMALFWSLLLVMAWWLPVNTTGQTLPELIIQKQEAFESLKLGDTHMEVPQVDKPLDLLLKWPAALFKALLSPVRPVPGKSMSVLLILDNLFFSLLIIVFLFRLITGYKPDKLSQNLFLSGFFLLLVCGFVVPNLGAMSRYRIMGLILLLPTVSGAVNLNLGFLKFIFSNAIKPN